ncbi:MAG: hypothetical protein ACM3QZ_08720 [Solirubrobacterales bacterium]
MSKYRRQLTSTEKIYVATNRISSPCATQLILEGTGTLDRSKWLDAIARSSEANPGTRLIARGALGCSYWADSGMNPELLEADASAWSGYGPEGAPFLQERLSCKGKTCQVVFLHGNSPRILFRSHHAVMDGRGTFHWIEEIFRALRGEPLTGNRSRITESQLARSFQKEGRTPAPHRFPAVTGPAVGTEPGFRWGRVTFPGHVKNFMCKTAVLLAHETWKIYPRCPIRYALPVDMRSRMPGLKSTGNLSNLIYLDITPKTTPESLQENLRVQLANKNDGKLFWQDGLIRFFPLAMIERSVKQEIRSKQAAGLYRNSGIISNIGKLDTSGFEGGGFKATNISFVPLGMESLPFFLGLWGTRERVELIMSMSNRLANRQRLEQLLQTMASEIK